MPVWQQLLLQLFSAGMSVGNILMNTDRGPYNSETDCTIDYFTTTVCYDFLALINFFSHAELVRF